MADLPLDWSPSELWNHVSGYHAACAIVHIVELFRFENCRSRATLPNDCFEYKHISVYCITARIDIHISTATVSTRSMWQTIYFKTYSIDNRSQRNWYETRWYLALFSCILPILHTTFTPRSHPTTAAGPNVRTFLIIWFLTILQIWSRYDVGGHNLLADGILPRKRSSIRSAASWNRL